MVSCAQISLEKIRARISFGTLIFETPDVKSFTVTKTRSSLPATFSASVDVPASTIFPIGEDVIIEAGVEGDLKRIFTGRVLSVTVNPSFESASSYVVNLSGSDRFQELEGKNVSRRQRARGLSSFAAISGVSSQSAQRGLSIEKRQQSGGSHSLPNRDTNIREHSKLVRTDRVAWDPFNSSKNPTSLENRDAASGQQGALDIKPRSVALSPGVSVRFTMEGSDYETGDGWEVSDEKIGSIEDKKDGTAVYTQRALGENTITFTKGNNPTLFGKATATGIPIHDHSRLGEGGPAFAVYGTE